jgi:hypothetical protein
MAPDRQINELIIYSIHHNVSFYRKRCKCTIHRRFKYQEVGLSLQAGQ